MSADVSTLKLVDADGFYEALLKGQDGLDDDQCALFNAKLVMLLANQVADPAVLLACIEAARQDLGGDQ